MIELAPYLDRVGYRGAREPSLEVLTALHAAHLAAIPFENLDILLGRPISLELPALQAKMVGHARGGYCFEQNTLFRAVLEALGFRVTPLAARVRAGAAEGVVRARTHMLLLVHLPQGDFVADVGFGGDGPVYPLPLSPGREHWTGGTGHRLRREEGLWVLEGNTGGHWGDLYAFTLEPQHPADYEMANHFTSTHPRSPFVLTLTAQRAGPERRSALRNRDLVVRDGATTRASTVRDPDHLLEILAAEFNLRFPSGTRFSRPEF